MAQNDAFVDENLRPADMEDRAHGRRNTRDGNPRHHHFHRESGLLVQLRRIPGKTHKKMLKRPFYFQVAPLESFGWEIAQGWEDYDTIRRGTFTRAGGRQLKTVTLNTLVVDYNPSWAVLAGGRYHRDSKRKIDEPGGKAPKPIAVADYLEKLLKKGTPMRLIARNRALWGRSELDMAVTLRTLNVRERAGEIDARYFDLSFTEYREPKVRRRKYGKDERLPARIVITRGGVAVEDDTEEKGTGKNPYTLGSPENPATLRRLAKHYYHDSNDWRLISAKNGIHHFGPDQSLAELWKRGRKFRRITVPKKHKIRTPEPKGKGD